MFFTPKRRLGFSVPSSPALPTPWSEKRQSDLRWADGGSAHPNRDKDVNVQVTVRCRPLNDEEQRMGVQKVIACHEQKREITVLQSLVSKQVDKTFAFDKVFGPKAQQRAVYDHAVSPIVNEVLEGFNCTVFAYGQTGTGKTYTMEGGINSVKDGQLSPDAGVIPRAVRQIFDRLDSQKVDYSMKVTFLELYNEEITDLLAPEDTLRYAEEKQRRPICLMEDGKGGAVIRGLEEEVVYNASEIFSLIERGSARRRTAETMLNTLSSRSHSIFSITIHIKEVILGDEELIKCGRLNLVDLAGSENIFRSGGREGRAREAGEVNKSLLTLGRVIIALADRSCHIPYRDSKLTRLLRESLGGKAKTCIIATVSPSIHSLEETLSTLDYAYRAKSIRNKPEANQKLSKSLFLKDLNLEIERLKQDVKAAREKNGVYIPSERFAKDETERKVMIEKIEQLSVDLDFKREEAYSFEELYNTEKKKNLELHDEIKAYKTDLENLNKAFFNLQENCRTNNSMLKEKDCIISNLLSSENAIIENAKKLQSDLVIASEDILKLHGKMDKKAGIEAKNKSIIMNFSSQIDQSLRNIHQSVIASISQQHQLLKCMEQWTDSFIARKCEETKNMECKIKKIKDTYFLGVAAMKELAYGLQNKANLNLEDLRSVFAVQTMSTENFLVTAVSEAEQLLNYIQTSLDNQRQLLSVSAKQQEMGLQNTLLSIQNISRTIIKFLHDVQSRMSNLMVSLEENQSERNRQFGSFKEKFQEVSALEEKAALEKITDILATVNTQKTKFVSEAMETMNLTSIERKTWLEQELSSMQQESSEIQKDWTLYIKDIESHFKEYKLSELGNMAAVQNILKDCSVQVDQSVHHWKNMQSSLDQLNRDGDEELDKCLMKGISSHGNLLDEFASTSSLTDDEINGGTSDLIDAVKNTLFLDHKRKEEVDPMSKMCLDLLKSLQDKHTSKITNITDQIQKCLLKKYLIDETGNTPKKTPMSIPSLASIEELRTHSIDDLRKLTKENEMSKADETKRLQLMQPEVPRNPLTLIN